MILIDTGPLVALIDSDDQYHDVCTAAFRTLRPERMGTVWPVLTEVMYFPTTYRGHRTESGRCWPAA